MATVYLVLLSPNAGAYAQTTHHVVEDDPSEPVLYVGYTDTTPHARFAKHLMETPAFRGNSPELVLEFSDLFPGLTKAQAHTCEAFAAEYLRSLGFKVICGAQLRTLETLGETVFVRGRAAAPAWNANKLRLKNGILECMRTKLECSTHDLAGLRQKVESFKVEGSKDAFGLSLGGGRFTINAHGQILRKLPPPPGFNENSVFAIRFDGDNILEHRSPIFRSNGEEVRGVGERLTESDLDLDVEEIGYDELEHLEAPIREIVENAVINYVHGPWLEEADGT